MPHRPANLATPIATFTGQSGNPNLNRNAGSTGQPGNPNLATSTDQPGNPNRTRNAASIGQPGNSNRNRNATSIGKPGNPNRNLKGTRYPTMGMVVGVEVEIFRSFEPNHSKNKYLHWL